MSNKLWAVVMLLIPLMYMSYLYERSRRGFNELREAVNSVQYEVRIDSFQLPSDFQPMTSQGAEVPYTDIEMNALFEEAGLPPSVEGLYYLWKEDFPGWSWWNLRQNVRYVRRADLIYPLAFKSHEGVIYYDPKARVLWQFLQEDWLLVYSEIEDGIRLRDYRHLDHSPNVPNKPIQDQSADVGAS